MAIIAHGTDDCSICFADEYRGVAQWKDAGIFVVWFCPAQIGEAIKELLRLLCADADVFTGLLRFALGKRFLSLGYAALLSETFRFPVGLLRLEVLRNVSSGSALYVRLRMLKLRCRSRDILRSSPFARCLYNSSKASHSTSAS